MEPIGAKPFCDPAHSTSTGDIVIIQIIVHTSQYISHLRSSFLHPLSKLLPLSPNIQKPCPLLQRNIRIPTKPFVQILQRLLLFLLNLACPFPPLYRFQIWRAEDDANADDEDGKERFNGDVQRQRGFRN